MPFSTREIGALRTFLRLQAHCTFDWFIKDFNGARLRHSNSRVDVAPVYLAEHFARGTHAGFRSFRLARFGEDRVFVGGNARKAAVSSQAPHRPRVPCTFCIKCQRGLPRAPRSG